MVGIEDVALVVVASSFHVGISEFESSIDVLPVIGDGFCKGRVELWIIENRVALVLEHSFLELESSLLPI